MSTNAVQSEQDSANGNGARTATSNVKVIVIGGSGRVGGSTVRALRQLAGPDLELVVGGRCKRNFESSVKVTIFSTPRRNVAAHDLLCLRSIFFDSQNKGPLDFR